MTVFEDVLRISTWVILGYFLLVNTFYAILLTSAAWEMRSYRLRSRLEDQSRLLGSRAAPRGASTWCTGTASSCDTVPLARPASTSGIRLNPFPATSAPVSIVGGPSKGSVCSILSFASARTPSGTIALWRVGFACCGWRK